MRLVFTDREAARSRGQAARVEIAKNYGEEQIAALIQQRLGVIQQRQRFPVFKQELRDFFSSYQGLAHRIQVVVRMVLPHDAVVVVISKGDERLITLDVGQASHFPQTAEGIYAGYYPAESNAAIQHLEALRARGSQFLLIPGTAFWWLDHYEDFARHLDANYQRIWDDDTCIIFRLSDAQDGTTRDQGGACA
jgi:hypothetical protein